MVQPFVDKGFKGIFTQNININNIIIYNPLKFN